MKDESWWQFQSKRKDTRPAIPPFKPNNPPQSPTAR
jgi:hypothetical protein